MNGASLVFGGWPRWELRIGQIVAALALSACRPARLEQRAPPAAPALDVSPSPRDVAEPFSRNGMSPPPGMTHCVSSFVSAMHTPIHDGWSSGFLRRANTLRSDDPLNDPELWTRVEIVLDRGGGIASVTTVRESGSKAFDAAARDVVLAAGPFPGAPPTLFSRDGSVYLHWAFHRDERACGTFGATPFLLEPPDDAPVVGKRPLADEATARVANDWLHYVHAGSIDDALRLSAVPFGIGEKTVAVGADELVTALEGLRATMAERPKAVAVLSPTQLCEELGGLPGGVEETTALTPALTKVGNDYLVLMLEAEASTWRVRSVALVPRARRRVAARERVEILAAPMAVDVARAPPAVAAERGR